MSDANGYAKLSNVELVTRALLYGSNANALLEEAERRQAASNRELTAVTGVPLTTEWTLIGLVAWPNAPDGVEMGICWRQKAKESE